MRGPFGGLADMVYPSVSTRLVGMRFISFRSIGFVAVSGVPAY